MPDNKSVSPQGEELNADDILEKFRETEPEEGEDSSEREDERQKYINELAEWAEDKTPKQRKKVRERLFELLKCDPFIYSESAHSEFKEDPYSTEDRDVNDLMRSYIPVFIGALYSNRDEKSENVRDDLFSRLKGEDDSEGKEFSQTVKQWLIRILMRVFPKDDKGKANDLLGYLNKIIDTEDNVLTQIVILAEVVRWLEKLEKKEIEDVTKVASDLFVKKLDSSFRSERTLAAQGLELLGTGVKKPDEAMEELCNRLEELRKEDKDKTIAKELSNWEVITEEAVERRAVIKAIEAVGRSKDIDVTEAIGLLRREAEHAGNSDDEDTDVKVAAVLALGKLGRLNRENGQSAEEKSKSAKNLKKVLETLTATAVRGTPTVAHAATQALSEIMEDEKAVADRLVDHYLDQDKPSDTERVADACRLTDHHHAIDKLADMDGEDEDQARRLIKKIGGDYAIETLGVPERYRWWKNFFDLVSLGFVILGLVVLLGTLSGTVINDDFSLKWSYFASAFFVMITFFASIVIAFPFKQEITALRYLFSGLLAFLFSFGMVGSISLGIQYSAELLNSVENVENREEVEFLAVHLFNGSYRENGADELLISFTPAPPDTVDLSTAGGFGAPGWVILLAVLGSAILTISVIVKEVSDRPDFGNRPELRDRVGKILQHQYYILFSPLGAVFVYQGLRMSEMASHQLTVALAAFGAGLALNIVLQKAVENAKNVLYASTQNKSGEKEGEKANAAT